MDWIRFSLLSVLYFKIVQKCLVVVLGREASVSQITVDVSPFTKATIVEKLEVVRNDKRNDTVGQAFLEHHQTAEPFRLENLSDQFIDLFVELFQCRKQNYQLCQEDAVRQAGAEVGQPVGESIFREVFAQRHQD